MTFWRRPITSALGFASKRGGGVLAGVLSVVILAIFSIMALTQLQSLQGSTSDLNHPPLVSPRAEARPFWRDLTARQQAELDTLKATWPSIEASQKQKWLEVTARMPQMTADEQARIKQRMSDWVALTPLERGQARIQFQEAQRLAPGGRQEQWEAYQALSPEQRRALAAQALVSAKKSAATASAAPKGVPGLSTNSLSSASVKIGPETKRNIANAPGGVQAPKQVAPTVVQSRQGATTSLITMQTKPPAHHQAGLPKVNAGPGFVDPATLLPLRGPQGAAAITPARSTELPVVDD